MSSHIDAGKLNQPLKVLELRETGSGVWEWVPLRTAWAQVEQTARTNLFSKVGVGARDAAVVIRRQSLTLHNALRWGERHLFLTAITQRGRGHLDVSAALVEVVRCRAQRTQETVGQAGRPVPNQVLDLTFPAVLTEKYARHEPQETYAQVESCFVLVTPKVIALKAGDLVTVQEGPAQAEYQVKAPHILDEWKNEYEIVWRRDV